MLRYAISELNYLKLNSESKSLDFSACRTSMRLAVLSDSAPQYLTPLFKTLLSKNGIRAEIYEAEYGTVELEIFNPASGLYAFDPDTIVILNSVFALRDRYRLFPGDKILFAEDQIANLRSLWTTLKERSNAAVVQSNFVLPYERLFGNYEEKVGNSFFCAIASINRALVETARSFNNVFINDVDSIASYHGRRHWLDEKMWILCKAFCAFEFLPHAVQNTVDILLSLQGAGVKCVVLDLDDTLWGGIIGDDGLEGIRLGHFGDGEAFQWFQHYLLDLKKRGILLAVCSKNDPENALLPFRNHPEMVLKENDITVFIANWVSKVENIKAIRETLNISFSSMVFIDDSPFERNLVREELPELIVPEMPEDPALFLRCLAEINLFETTSYSEIDAERAELYRLEAQRKIAEKHFSNPEDYLKSLDMKITLKRFDPFNLPRIAQLLQRSNQFNLLTRRFSEAQCETFMQDRQGWLPIYLKLRDKYGDNGLISVVIGRIDAGTMRIEEWVMSCRVLARGVEQYAMNYLFEFARGQGISLVKASYQPTSKNQMVKEFFGRFGFQKVQENAKGATDWALETNAYEPRIHFIETEQEEIAGCKDPK